MTKLSKEDKLEVVQINCYIDKSHCCLSRLVKILAKEFPELFELLGDYKERMSEVIEFQPLLKTARSHDILSSKVTMVPSYG